LKERSNGDNKKARMTNGGAIAKRNDNELAVDRVSVADGHWRTVFNAARSVTKRK
jgi:hypothetical protein